MCQRYGQRPSSLLPTEVFLSEEQQLAFDFNVMMMGLQAEMRARGADQPKKHMTSNRSEAYSLARKARAVADEIWGKEQHG